MLIRQAILMIVAITVVGCGEDNEPSSTAPPPPQSSLPVAQQLAATGAGRFLGISPTAMSHNGEWEEYTYDPDSEGAVCLGGTNYQVNLRRGNTNKVLLYLEGGGACWNFETCWQASTAKSTAGSAFGYGILDAADPANPFGDWNVVYASYCDGSVYSGDNAVDYNGRRTYHHGLQNLSAAVSLMLHEFPHPELMVVSGSSAGGYGTFPGYAVTRIAYPDTPLFIFDDSGPGLQNLDDTQGVADRLANWHILQFPQDCDRCTAQPTYLADWALDRDSTLRVALFSYLKDSVIRTFLKLDGPHYEALLRSVTDDIQNRHPDRFKRFFKTGTGHTVLELPLFNLLAINGTTVRDWTADFLADGPAWQDLVEP
jgi:hypothetical protein